ncbi:SulP family inorganic anion transporter [Plasticicumulans acidivorans]|uniref:High affinity sulfate transporter 1 n=1 Tax=Plasticicumulans acidivorans TaxID=886464 RepID=A0A317MUR7_9GAMM|nr:SulP family inorganic anion transporter [Plasticicumulans acidivorans]PWV61186.1 high affinity sulfate transporter 1 [Plasticicumulans acidivorans]
MNPALRARLARFAPGLAALSRYRPSDLPHDLAAGVSVAAVALPVGVAYAQLAGFEPIYGLYASILPLLAYALFGTSRQLIVGPDAATCAMIAAAITPLAGGNAEVYLSLSITLAFIAGVFCIGASFLRLGALADFLSQPILIGFLNGISLSILLGQIGKVFGFSIDSGGIVPRLLEFAGKLEHTHLPTLAVGCACFAVLWLGPRWLPRVPAALLATVVAAALVAGFQLDAHGVAVLGRVPGGLPALHWPSFSPDLLEELFGAAAGVALVSFSSAMLTARSFAARNHYEIDVDREFAALGAANIAAALSQSFAISGADSRTAMADAAGGRSQLTGVFAAACIAVVLLFFTEPLAYVPVAALGAVLIKASLSLLDLHGLRELWRLDRLEFGLSLLTTLGVVAVGAIDAILIAVVLALLRFIHMVARPRDEVLGEVDGLPGLHSIERHAGARTFPGLVMFRFDSPLTFFNAGWFRQRALRAAEAAGPPLQWFIIDAIPISQMDVTGLFALRALRRTLNARGVRLVLAGRRAEILDWVDARGLRTPELDANLFPTLRQALKAYQRETAPLSAPKLED